MAHSAAPECTPAPLPEAEPDDLALDPQQRALVDAQWALVERAFRRDMPQRDSDRQAVEPVPVPEPVPAPRGPRAADEIVEPVAGRAPAQPRDNAAAPTPGPADRAVDVAAAVPRAQPKVRSRWFGGPSIAEQKRIVKPKRWTVAAPGSAQRQGALLTSVVAIACVSAAFAFWRLDQADRRVTAEPPASASPARSVAPATSSAVPATSAATQSARQAVPARPSAAQRPATAAASSDPGAARSAGEFPVATRRQESAAEAPPATAPVRTPPAQRTQETSAASTRPAWRRDERPRNRDADPTMRIAPSWVAPQPELEPEVSAPGPMPAPLPYHSTPSAGWRTRPGTAADTTRESAAPLPYGGPEIGATQGGR